MTPPKSPHEQALELARFALSKIAGEIEIDPMRFRGVKKAFEEAAIIRRKFDRESAEAALFQIQALMSPTLLSKDVVDRDKRIQDKAEFMENNHEHVMNTLLDQAFGEPLKPKAREFWIARPKELGTMPIVSLSPFEIKENNIGKYIRDYLFGINSWISVSEVVHLREILDEPHGAADASERALTLMGMDAMQVRELKSFYERTTGKDPHKLCAKADK